MIQRTNMMLVLLFIGAFFCPVYSSGLYDDLGGGGNPGPAADFLDTYKGPSGPEEGLYGPAPISPIADPVRAPNNGATHGPNYPPESAIDQFEVGYGGTYYRKGEQGDQGRDGGNTKPNNNHIGYGPSGSSFDKPLDSYRENDLNPLNLNGLSAVELEQLRNLAEAAQGLRNTVRQGSGGGGNGGAGSGGPGGPNIVENHGTLGPLLPKNSQDDKGLSYGSGGGASSSYNPTLLEYGPGGGHGGVLQDALHAQIKLNALRTQLLSRNLAQLNLQRHAHAVHAGAYGPPGYHNPAVGYGLHPLDHLHKSPLNLNPLFGKLEAVDAHLIGKLQDKDLQLANLEREKHALIAAAGNAALGSIREKEKLVHLYGQLGIADALNKPLGKHGPHPEPGLGYHPAAGADKAAAIADKAAALADKAAAHANKAADIANHHAAEHEYNPNFGPVPVDKIHLNPIKSLGYGPPPLLPGGYNGGFANGYGAGAGLGSFRGFGGPLSPAAREVLAIHPIYNQPLAVKQVHNVIVKEQLKGQHYYGPGPGPNYSLYNGKAVGKGLLGLEHGLAPHQQPGPYPPVDDLVHQQNAGYHHGKLDGLVASVAKNTAKALVGALQGAGYGYGNYNNYHRHH